MSEEKRVRHRLSISCFQCRRRKRRCDRNQPCQTCKNRGEGDSCTYDSPETMPSAHQMRLEDVRSDNTALRNRVQRLEEVIRTMAKQNVQRPEVETSSPLSDLTDSSTTRNESGKSSSDKEAAHNISLGPGVLAGPRTTSRYKTISSWDSILNELQDLRLEIEDAFDPLERLTPIETLGHKFGPFSAQSVSFTDLFSILPARQDLDTLLLQYLNSYHPFYPYIHPNTFKRQYRLFMANPADPIFLAQIFAMLALAVVNYDPKNTQADKYASSSLLALQLSEFTMHFTVTTVTALLNLTFFYQRERKQNTFAWVVFGLTLQIARALGLHRDPTHFGITGLECQSRRHIWSAILSQDGIHSARYGRSTIIDPSEWDTKRPDEVSDDLATAVLPVPASYSRVKRMVAMSITKMFKKFYMPDSKPTYPDIMAMDSEIREAHSNLPHYLKNNTTGTPVHLLYTALSPFLLCHTLIVLHRPFCIKKGRDYQPSRDTCLKSARDMLRVVENLQAQENIGQYRWHVRELVNISYIPVITALCVGLHISENYQNFDAEPLSQEQAVIDRATIERMIATLEPGSQERRVGDELYAKVCGTGNSMNPDFGLTETKLSAYVATEGQANSDMYNMYNMSLRLGVGGQVDWNQFISAPAVFGRQTPGIPGYPVAVSETGYSDYAVPRSQYGVGTPGEQNDFLFWQQNLA